SSFLSDPFTTQFYTLSLHDALPIWIRSAMSHLPTKYWNYLLYRFIRVKSCLLLQVIRMQVVTGFNSALLSVTRKPCFLFHPSSRSEERRVGKECISRLLEIY